MFFAPSTIVRRTPSSYALERFLSDALATPAAKGVRFEQDDKAYNVSFDLPGVAREQLTIGIEGNVVRVATIEGAPRAYKAAYELPLDIDAATSEAKLENGVLTLKLAKKVPVSNVAQLAIQ